MSLSVTTLIDCGVSLMSRSRPVAPLLMRSARLATISAVSISSGSERSRAAHAGIAPSASATAPLNINLIV
jgi:hypothetical protein